jgi:transposase
VDLHTDCTCILHTNKGKETLMRTTNVTVTPVLLADRLVPDDLWSMVAPLVPPPKTRPQGGGRSRVDDRSVFVATVYLLTANVAWRRLPPYFNVTVPTVYRRHVQWLQDGVWNKILARAAEQEYTWAETVARAALARVPEPMSTGTR